MKFIIILAIATFFNYSSFGEVNFSCDIFSVAGGGYASGSLTLSGENPMQQSFELSITDSNEAPMRSFERTVYLKGAVNFSDLNGVAQESITSAINNSKRPDLTTGTLMLFSNVQENSAISTLNIYLMPSGEIGYIEVGVLPVLCM